MSIIIVMYIIFPVLMKLLKWNPLILLVISFSITFCKFINFRELNFWLTPFVLGMICSYYDVFYKIKKYCNSMLQRIILSFFLVLLSIYLRCNIFENQVYFDSLFAFSIIIFSYFLLSAIPYLNKLLELLGRHSANIFMFHTFIYSYYFSQFTYSLSYSLLIYIVLVTVCLLISVVIEFIKDKIKYKYLFKKLLFAYNS